MVDKKGKVRGLGRGLSALMSDVSSTSKEQGQPADTIPVKSDMNVPIEKIFPNPDQPRRNFTEVHWYLILLLLFESLFQDQHQQEGSVQLLHPSLQ